ncbi:glycosyltransferase family 39 protein [Paraglaciecola chathamensis]|uniref:Glycosyltransferase family 39 protein n=1 Tax=Paraglaciecola chathamensis TaxID=368405 RepID=A0ABS0W9H6_9ALTE|nr:glycosyltransferase family 39 protein [Paraglaciecola chathamensis]MBJ2135021.1 glycosyltransferase family 39 protein [Paraglaciecola chathamensis]
MNMNDRKRQQQFAGIVLLLTAAALILIGLGLRDPWPADEPRFAQIAKEMVESGQWLFPTRGGEYYPDKPPVFMWAIAFFYVLTGSIHIAFLLPSALASLLTVFLVYDLGKRLWNESVGLTAGALLLFSVQFLLQSKTAQIDAMVSCWITIGCYGLLRFILIERRWLWYYLAFFFMGLGVITKGVGFLPVLMLLPYYFFQKTNTVNVTMHAQRYDVWRWLAGPIFMFLAIGLWLVPMLIQVELSQDPALIQYRDNILFRQTVTRYADSWHHLKPFWYYMVEVIPLFWLPVSVAVPWLLPKWYQAFKNCDARIILPASWILLLVLFFSISPGKRGVYILPALPMLVIISAPYVKELISKTSLPRLLWVVVAALSILCLGVGFAGLAKLTFLLELENKYGLSPWLFFLFIGALGVGISLFTVRKKIWQAWPLFISLLMVGYSTWGYVLLDDVKTPKNIFRNIQAIVKEQNVTIGLVNFSEQFILFSPYSVVHFGYHSELSEQINTAYHWLGKGDDARYVLVDEDNISGKCFDLQKAKPVGYAHRKNWILLSAEARKPECGLSALIPDLKIYRYEKAVATSSGLSHKR